MTAAAALALSLFGAPAAALTPEFVSPFLIPNFGGSPELADIDGDGDLDAFFGNSDVVFFENIGTSTAPAFAAPSANPFGLTDVGAVTQTLRKGGKDSKGVAMRADVFSLLGKVSSLVMPAHR